MKSIQKSMVYIWHIGICILYTDTISNFEVKIWKLILDKIKDPSRLSVFESKVKSWRVDSYPYRLKVFVKDLGFVEVYRSP